jgi:hypothetical protein
MAQKHLIRKLVRTHPKKGKQQVMVTLPADWVDFDFVQLEFTTSGQYEQEMEINLTPITNEDIIKQLPKDFRGKKVFRVGTKVQVEKWYGNHKLDDDSQDYESIGDWEDKNINGNY